MAFCGVFCGVFLCHFSMCFLFIGHCRIFMSYLFFTVFSDDFKRRYIKFRDIGDENKGFECRTEQRPDTW